jgi:hypothetical protein
MIDLTSIRSAAYGCIAIAERMDAHNKLVEKQNDLMAEQNRILTQILGQMKVK